MNPIDQFNDWFTEAKKSRAVADATAVCLATAGSDGVPTARMVLLKNVDHGFVFYTNLESRKSVQMRGNPRAALCFYWQPIGKQVRIEGKVEPVSEAEADAYFASRPRDSRIGAWASQQSQPMSGREELLRTVAEIEAKYKGRDIPRPPFWSGWRLIPEMLEFWQEGEHRLHDRERFTREGKGWTAQKLYP